MDPLFTQLQQPGPKWHFKGKHTHTHTRGLFFSVSKSQIVLSMLLEGLGMEG